MKRSERLRRVLICSCHFTQNLAFYHAGWRDKKLIRKEEFWIRLNGNCLDIAVVEWCKLFGERKGKHYWRNILAQQDTFESELYTLLGGKDFHDAYVDLVRTYRDKFVAHLDDELEAHIPNMDDALSSSRLYYNIVLEETKSLGAIGGLPQDIEALYDSSFEVARKEYEAGT